MKWGNALSIIAVAALATTALASTAGATTVLRVTLVVHEPFAGGGTILETNVPGCEAGEPVATVDMQVRSAGQSQMFTGSKIVDCGAEGTFTFAFRAIAKVECSPNDVGTWMIVDGTETFENVGGGGRLKGTYTPAGACPPEVIDDAWTGVMIFR